MDLVTGRASFDPGGAMFMKKRAAFISVAFQTGLVLESSQSFSCGRLMRIVAV
jgi:hypothetical protein